MHLTPFQTVVMILAVALGTQLTRWLPFLLFPEGRAVPKTVSYLGRVLPPAAMGLLVVYCLRKVQFAGGTCGLPEMISIALTVLLHLKFRKMLVSIAVGTVCYMVLVQMVF